MKEPQFLNFDLILKLHEISLQKYGGLEGIRDLNTLRSAVDSPLNDYFYGNSNLFAIAAAYAFHIAQSQTFLDGNKRTGIAAALTFLEGNGVSTNCETEILYDAMIAIAEKRMTKTDLATLFQKLFE